MKRLLTAVLALGLCLSLIATADARSENALDAIATNNAISLSNSADTPDAHLVHPAVYKIEGANYFKLRDLGKALDFYVGYDDVLKTVFLSGAKSYPKS